MKMSEPPQSAELSSIKVMFKVSTTEHAPLTTVSKKLFTPAARSLNSGFNPDPPTIVALPFKTVQLGAP